MKTKQTFLLVLFITFQMAFSQTPIENSAKKNTKNNKQLISIINDTTQIENHLTNPYLIDNFKYEHIYFVLGTLSDYMGRFRYINREKQVDRYYPYEKPLVNYLTKYIKTELNIKLDTIFEKSNHCNTYSDELSKILNSFYGTKDELINDKFETNTQICSFLSGVYYRYGDKLDTNVYKIQLANSPKHQICYEFLKRIGCKKIFYKYLKNIPVQFILYFEPTDELKTYLDFIESERLILNESLNMQIEEIMKGSKTTQELIKNSQLSRKLEVEKIINAFR